ncbi:MAG: phosphoenolpyruvate--protein phosphotransferase [Spirochaetia bacterium]|jgi:phosphotransferase system enzyme I (PtsP)|nr:phosphoenolpyruvate--protein phosphotransferase [Spirochaetia bacterium]
MNTDHAKMLYGISELNSLFEENSIEQFLQKTVNMVAQHMNAEVCSIYIYNEHDKKLTLKATQGLNPDIVNHLSIGLGEGLAGTALLERRIICEKAGKDNSNFKYYPESGEIDSDSFLISPIIRGIYSIGVLVVQRGKGHFFDENDIMAIEATASQLETLLEHVKHITQPAGRSDKPYFEPDKFHFFKGKTGSQGCFRAPLMIKPVDKNPNIIAKELNGCGFTIADFEEAIEKTYTHLELIQKKIEEKLADAASLIFASHLLMLKDNGFTGAMRELILAGRGVTDAVMDIFLKYKKIFSESPNALIKEKTQDIEDLASEILNNLLNKSRDEGIYKDHIIVARELFPSELLMLSADGIAGIVLVSGGVTSHVGILARSLMIPIVIINNPLLLAIPNGTDALIDADVGNLYINPTPEVLHNFDMQRAAKDVISTAKSEAAGKSVTLDGAAASVLLNINLISDLKQIEIENIDGIGLYRTEFPFMIRDSFPSEEEQYFIYRKLISGMAGKPVTFRTLDIGGDKALAYYDFPNEKNPFLGMRSIRFSLEHIGIFKQQIRAILRAGQGADLKIMFPMISSLDEFLSAKDIVKQCIYELYKSGTGHNSSPGIGMMVEIPSLLPVIDDLAKETDFFSIGTNDLIQYTLAVDRTNEKVSSLYIPHHPAILRALKQIADAAIKAGIDVSVCGDMANKELYIPFIIGIGITSLSVDAMYIPRVKRAIRAIDLSKAKLFAERLLTLTRIDEIEAALREPEVK